MGVDLHRIGLGISSGTSRTGFGTIVSFPSVAFPANGSYNSTLNDVEYPIAEGGASVTVLSEAYPSQTCDVDVENDGAGGTYTDWTTATDVQYRPSALYGLASYFLRLFSLILFVLVIAYHIVKVILLIILAIVIFFQVFICELADVSFLGISPFSFLNISCENLTKLSNFFGCFSILKSTGLENFNTIKPFSV